jgi:hypothetical protein
MGAYRGRLRAGPGGIMKRIGAFALLVACLTLTTSAHAQTKVRLAVGGKPAMFYLPLTVVERLGYFKDAGLDVEISDFPGGARALQSLIGGSADVVAGAFDHTIQMQAKGQSIVAVVELGQFPGFVLGVLTAKAGTYRNHADLKGFKIGITAPGSSTHFMARYLMAQAGLKDDDAAFHRNRRRADGGRCRAARRNRRPRQRRSGDQPVGKRQGHQGRCRHPHAGGHPPSVRRQLSGRCTLRHTGVCPSQRRHRPGADQCGRARPALDRRAFAARESPM